MGAPPSLKTTVLEKYFSYSAWIRITRRACQNTSCWNPCPQFPVQEAWAKAQEPEFLQSSSGDADAANQEPYHYNYFKKECIQLNNVMILLNE